jgi:glutathione-regulated potassium-efflux system ancillary protein KefG
VNHIPDSENITFHDLYEQYPNFDIDVKIRTRFIEQTYIIIWHHPMYGTVALL